mmetsp:Transcript_46778/g.73226  ORF Transcript_46778/g.73226 Transcript_46778/m.73226 type:complete len:92 (-) Transcript_46778:377-652(-)
MGKKKGAKKSNASGSAAKEVARQPAPNPSSTNLRKSNSSPPWGISRCCEAPDDAGGHCYSWRVYPGPCRNGLRAVLTLKCGLQSGSRDFSS